MFFPEKITRIKSSDRVLEIGPGSSPHPRADVLLEKKYTSVSEYMAQCGDQGMKAFDKRLVFYGGGKFPFDDSEFDYVICSHVLEHVIDVEAFVSEIFRVAKAGYFEYPLIYYDYIYGIPEHVTLLKKGLGGGLVYHPKLDLFSSELAIVRQLYHESLNAGHFTLIRAMLPCLFEGFEWSTPFDVRRAKDVVELCHVSIKIPPPAPEPQGFKYHWHGMRKIVSVRFFSYFNILLPSVKKLIQCVHSRNKNLKRPG